MPLYEFKCKDCGYLFETLMKSSDSAPANCPKCGTAFPEKQFSAFAVSNGAVLPTSCSDCCGSMASPCSGGSCPLSGGGFGD